MNTCRAIEPLLYLYRDGELSAQEKAKVTEHISSCSRCAEILKQLESMDSALAPLRESTPELAGERALLERTMDIITGKGLRGAPPVGRPQKILLGWLKPALSFAVLGAVALFLAQQSRDALKITDLEKRLRTEGNAAIESGTSVNSEARRLLGLAMAAQKEGARGSPSVKSSAMAGDPTSLLGAGILNLFHKNSTLFDEFSSRYPNLSKITLEDGIDEHEKKILDTEGKAFLRDFEQLLREGAK